MAKKLTSAKAKKILHDKSVHGHPLTEQQRKFFGAIAGGAKPYKAEEGGWLDKYEAQDGVTTKERNNVLNYLQSLKEPQSQPTKKDLQSTISKSKPLVATNTREAYEAKRKEKYGKQWEAEEREAQRLKEERAAAEKTRKEVVAGYEDALFTFPTGETKKWKDMDFREQQYVVGRNLGSFNRGDWTDYINPVALIGSMGEGLATSPYEARRTNSILPYITGVGAPLLTGALAGIGTKGNTAQFVENIISPLPVSASDVTSNVKKAAQSWQMKELPGLHLKSTMSDGAISKIVEPKTGLVNVEQALGIIGKESGGKEKVGLIKKALGDTPPQKMDYNEFRKTVQDQIIPLERQFSTKKSDYGINNLGYNRGWSTEWGGNKMEVVESLPIENQTLILSNKGKFGKGSDAHGNPEETLGHIHFLRDAETPDVLTVTQIQSDAFQGSHRTMPKSKENAMFSLERQEEHVKALDDLYSKAKPRVGNDGTVDLDFMGRPFFYELPDGQVITREIFEETPISQRKINELRKIELENFEQKSLLDKSHQERYLQEIMSYAGERGMNKLRLPTSETAAKVQGYIKGTGQINRESLSPEELKIVESFGYSSEQNTILKKYSEQPKIIKKLFGAEPKTVTDSRGNTWYEIDVPKSFKEGKGEIKAFEQGGWLDKYEQGGMVLKQKETDNYGKKANPNEVDVSLPPGFKGWAYNTKGRNYSPAWGGQFAMGGSIPGAVGFTYARTAGAAPSNGPYAKKTKASAQNGQEMKYYQEGLDFTPKTISQDGSEIPVDSMGYWNPDNWGNPVIIPSTDITMEGVDQPLIGISDTGDVQYMEPGEDYQFDGKYVTEYPVMQKGGRVPIYTDNPNDPRLKAYQDSLAVYKTNIWPKHNEPIKKYSVPKETYKIIGKDKDGKDVWGLRPYKPTNIEPAYQYDYIDNSQVGKETIFEKIGKIKAGNFATMLLYKKPVQPVEYKKPEQKNVDLGYKLPEPKTPTAPKIKGLISEEPTNYSYTYQSPSGEQKSIYFPTKSAWKAFVDQYDGLNTQETSKGASASPGVYSQQRRPSPAFKDIKFKNGGVSVNDADAQPIEKLDQLLNFTNYNKPTKGGWLDKYN